MIRNIIFDFGNVLFDLHLGAFEQQMRVLWGEHFQAAKEKLLRERVFELYESMSEVTKAGFLQDVNSETPVSVKQTTSV